MGIEDETKKSLILFFVGSLISFFMIFIRDINDDFTSTFIWLSINVFIVIVFFNQNAYKENIQRCKA